MEETHIMPLSGEKISHVLTRIALALVYLSFGYVQLISPAGWVSYLPGVLQRLPVDGQFFIFLNGSMEIILGLFMLLGIFIRPVAFVLGVHLFGIAATIGFNAVGIRDFGLSLATLGVAFAGNDSFSIEGWARRHDVLRRTSYVILSYLLIAMLAGSALAFSIKTYNGPFLAGVEADGTTDSSGTVDVPKGVTLNAAVVGSHASAEDCWIVVSERIYAVSEYIPFHPGGAKRITDMCGTDATVAFATKGGTGSAHSDGAKSLLEKYFVGLLGQTVTATGSPSVASGQSPLPTVPLVATGSPTPAPAGTLTTAAVATHNSASDCWIIVSGNVYNVTAYIPFHPGGTSRIVNVCGQDATTAFNTRGGTGSHSSNARSLLANYFIGALGATVTATPSVMPTPTPTPTPTAMVTPTPAPTTSLTADAVATHNSASDCWIIVSGNVYNVTAYIPFHPGGTSRITNVCGKEATIAFNTRGGSGSHSSNARSLLANYLIGALGSTVTPTPTPSPGATPTPSPGDPLTPYRNTIYQQYPGAVISQLSLEDDGRAEFKFTYNGNSYEGKMNAQYQITDIE